jgi:hypothetical protein
MRSAPYILMALILFITASKVVLLIGLGVIIGLAMRGK